jgi:uncharacterized protein involved in high-affinity Fe2+ transport
MGEPMVKENLQLVPNYLKGIKMSGMAKGMSMKEDATHLELDVHAAQGEKHGFAEDMWIPDLTIRYTLTKEGSKFKKTGELVPMTAGDGPHYANNVDFDGPGKYHVAYTILPPSRKGFQRHIDTATGVPDWWKSIQADWTFDYPSKEK